MSDDKQIIDRWRQIEHRHRTDEQICKCLSQIETLLWGPGSEADLYEIPERILFIAREMPNWHMYRVIEWIISTSGDDDTAVFQQVIYYMISCLDFPRTRRSSRHYSAKTMSSSSSPNAYLPKKSRIWRMNLCLTSIWRRVSERNKKMRMMNIRGSMRSGRMTNDKKKCRNIERTRL
jgi:hypothetical protein